MNILLLLVLLALPAVPARPTEPLTLIHWNDFHARNQPWVTALEGDSAVVGGAARLAWMLDSLRAAHPEALALHAGDEFTGTPVSSLTRGASQIALLNLLRPDAFVPGNHEFDYGWDTLRARLAQARFPVVCANLADSAGAPAFPPCVVLERSALRVAVIGVTLPGLAQSVLPGNLGGLRTTDPAAAVNRLLDSLEAVSEVQIALTHQGVEADRALARACPRLEAIVGGHRHAELFEPLVEAGVPILQAGEQGKYLGLFRAEVDTAAGRLVAFTGRLLPVRAEAGLAVRAEVGSLVRAQETAVSAELDRVVGRLARPWVRSEAGESNVGNWVADATARLTGRPVAFMNSGGLRADLPAGPVTLRQVWELHPFGNRLVGFDLSGEELRRAVLFQANQSRDLLQVSGLRYRVRRESGEVLELSVGGEPVDPEGIYGVAANEYIAAHAEKYFGFALEDRLVTDLGWTDRDLTAAALQQAGEVDARVEGRIRVE
ncbi:MAG: bifunctional metallophosphatase/5'-nucleotidase [Candidatus Zixiibacteriota bacterium]|nr:MAG: bifunctional metallophosphatase/5'-nucleotidase [candidate division Zixibacteria bacterium]